MLVYCIVKRRRVVQDINLYQLLKFYVKKWYLLVIFAIIGGLAGYIYSTYIQTPLYKSDATLLLVSTEERKIEKDTTLINNYIALIKSRRVLDPVISKLGHSISYDELVGSTTATNEKNTEVIKLNIASKDPEISKKLVEGVVVSFKEQVKELYKLDNINVVDNANKATQPYNVKTVILTVITSGAGFLLAVAFLFFAYDLGFMQKLNQPKPRGRPSKKVSRIKQITHKLAILLGTEFKKANKEKSHLITKNTEDSPKKSQQKTKAAKVARTPKTKTLKPKKVTNKKG